MDESVVVNQAPITLTESKKITRPLIVIIILIIILNLLSRIEREHNFALGLAGVWINDNNAVLRHGIEGYRAKLSDLNLLTYSREAVFNKWLPGEIKFERNTDFWSTYFDPLGRYSVGVPYGYGVFVDQSLNLSVLSPKQEFQIYCAELIDFNSIPSYWLLKVESIKTGVDIESEMEEVGGATWEDIVYKITTAKGYTGYRYYEYGPSTRWVLSKGKTVIYGSGDSSYLTQVLDTMVIN